ncbi:hypothetical protein ACFQDO_04955, partial [Angustibacter luteus]
MAATLVVPAALAGQVLTAATASADSSNPSSTGTVQDSFTRSLTPGWGAADSGAAWELNYQSPNFSVSGGAGRIATGTPGATYSAFLPGQSRDVLTHADLSVSTAQTGSGTYLTVAGRGTSDGDGYRAKLRLLADGSVNLALVHGTGAKELTFKSARVAGLTYAPGTQLHVLVGVTGSAPVQVAAKVWQGSTEPAAWTMTATDAAADPAMGNGGLGLSAYLSGSSTKNAQVVSVDNLWSTAVSTLDAPLLAITAGPQEGVSTRTVPQTFEFVAAGAGTAQCRVDTAAWSACTSPTAVQQPADGAHSFQLRGVAPDGKVVASAARTWVLDTTAPVPAVTSGPAAGSTTASAAATFAVATNEPATLSCVVDGGAAAPCTSPVSLTGLNDGAHTLSVVATDSVGNVSSAVSRAWKVDTTAPVLSLTSGPAAGATVASSGATFDVATDGPAALSCTVDGAAAKACTSPVSLTGLGDGAHTLVVTGADAVGNVSSPVSRSWKVDTAAPVLSLTSGPAAGATVTSGSATFDVTTDEPATLSCKLDAAAAKACTSPVSFSGLADGAHTLVVTATDVVGNGGSSVTRSWKVDTAAPVTTVSAGPAEGSSQQGTSVQYTFAANETATFACRLDGGSWTVCTSPVSYSGLAVGAHTIDLRATDSAGNIASLVTRHVTVLAAAPPVPAGKPGASNTGVPAGTAL